LRRGDSIDEQLHRGKRFLLRGRFSRYLAYFQQETPTAMEPSVLLPILAHVLEDPACIGLILAARPDSLQADLLDPLADLVSRRGKECLIELGVQSIQPQSLQFLNRHHSVNDIIEAAAMVRNRPPLQLGAHLLLGIPGETEAAMRATLDAVVALGTEAVKLHHLQVIRGTPLAELFARGRVEVFTADRYLRLLLNLLPHLPTSVTIHRLWSTAHPDLLIAPRWNLLTAELSEQLRQSMVAQNVRQGGACKGLDGL
jgi:radical SAM protein (TIGR01212 family)